MSDVVVSMEPSTLSVEPGGQARVVVTIANQSSIVEGYQISVVDNRGSRGAESGPADWADILPPDSAAGQDAAHVSVYPQQRQEVVLIFSPPPGGDALGGSWAFAVRVKSVVNEGSSVVVEGDLELGKVLSTQGKLTPVTSSGRWRGWHVVQLTNWGNTARRLRLRGEDPDQALGFLILPEIVEVPVGGTAQARLKVRTRAPRLRGTVARLPFTVVGTEDTGVAEGGTPDAGDDLRGVPDPGLPPGPMDMRSGMPTADGERVVVDGAFTQRPILTRALVTGMVLLLAGLIALVAYGFSHRVDVPTYESEGMPATPTLTAQATGPETVLLSWAPIAQVQKYQLNRLQGDSDTSVDTQDLDAALGAHPVEGLTSDSKFCFTLTAVRGKVKSPPSEPACDRTEALKGEDAPATAQPSDEETGDDEAGVDIGADVSPTTADTPSPTPGGDDLPPVDSPSTDSPGDSAPIPDVEGLDPGEWVAPLGTFPEASLGRARAEEMLASLREEQIEATLIFSGEYPAINPAFIQPTWIVYLDENFASRESALDGCRQVRQVNEAVTFCDPPIQPGGP